MLMLSRKAGQRICIGDDIVVVIGDIDRRSNSVKVGVEAPRNISVDREEVRMKKESS